MPDASAADVPHRPSAGTLRKSTSAWTEKDRPDQKASRRGECLLPIYGLTADDEPLDAFDGILCLSLRLLAPVAFFKHDPPRSKRNQALPPGQSFRRCSSPVLHARTPLGNALDGIAAASFSSWHAASPSAMHASSKIQPASMKLKPRAALRSEARALAARPACKPIARCQVSRRRTISTHLLGERKIGDNAILRLLREGWKIRNRPRNCPVEFNMTDWR